MKGSGELTSYVSLITASFKLSGNSRSVIAAVKLVGQYHPARCA